MKVLFVTVGFLCAFGSIAFETSGEEDSDYVEVPPAQDYPTRVGYSSEMELLLNWALDNGLDFEERFELANISGVGRGLIAKREFKSGDLLMSIPKALLITPQTAQSSEIGKMFKSEGLPDCRTGTFEDCTVLLALHLLQIFHDKESFWAPWMSILPRTLGTPVVWSEGELEDIEGSNLHEISEGWRNKVMEVYDRTVPRLRRAHGSDALPLSHFSLPEFTWAYMTIYSRAFDIDMMAAGRQQRQRVLSPLVDMFNHGPVRGSYKFDDRKGLFELYTHQDYSIGQEVYLNYDNKNNADFLLQYGFVIPSNPFDYVGVVAAVGPEAENYDLKKELLSELGIELGQSHKLFMKGLPDKSFNSMRILCSSKEDLASGAVRDMVDYALAAQAAAEAASTRHGGGQEDGPMDGGRPISLESERCAYRTMVSAVQALLDKYPTRLIDDDAILARNESLPARRLNALILRRDEKRILIFNLSRYKRRLDALVAAKSL